jgi:hypothetical protein
MLSLEWLTAAAGSRAVIVTDAGAAALNEQFGIRLEPPGASA